jgi:hypothetical protein
MPARTRAPALAVLLAASALGLVRTWHVTNRDSDYRPVGRLLSRAARPEEPILLVPPDNGVSLYYYLRDTRMRWESVRDPSQLTGRLATAPGSRAWVVVDYRSPLYRLSPAGLRDMLGAEPTLQRRFDAGGASGVMLLQVPAGIARPARREGEGLPPRPPPAGTH